MPGAPLYLDTSAVLRAILEAGTTPDIESRIGAAPVLLTSRLSLVESARALHRLRSLSAASEAKLAGAARHVDALWQRCEIWELSRSVCDLAATVAPTHRLRTLDALHLATFVLARERIPTLQLLTADDRLRTAAGA